jgi:multidrug efflux pump subunit AcrA (membrane-fusion protein)
LLLCSAVVLSSCGGDRGGNKGRAEDEGSQGQSVAITKAVAETRNIPAVIQATGTLIADESSGVAAKIAGKIVNVGTDVGRYVKEGAVIAKIDDRDAKNRLIEARAGVKQSEAALRQAEARIGLGQNKDFSESAIPEVRVAGANYEQAKAELGQAEANEKRYRELVETGDVSVVSYEQYRTQRDTARARANAAKEQLEAAMNGARQNNQAVRSAEAALEAAKAKVATAEQDLADTEVKAPFSGYVSQRSVAVGEYVTSASVIATVVRTNPMKVQIRVAEADIPYLAVGRTVSIEVEAYRGRKFNGTVKAVNPSLDPASRSASVEATLDNSDNTLRAGMFATVRITREGGSDGVFVPKSAIYSDPTTQSYRVFVIEEGIAKLKVVQLGIEEGDSYQVLAGVAAGETVATSALGDLFEGAKVSFQ